MSTTYKNQMEDSFTITKEFQASAHYGTGIEQVELTATAAANQTDTELAEITGYVTTLTPDAARTLVTYEAAKSFPVGQEFTIINVAGTAFNITITNSDGGLWDLGLESDYSTRSNLVLQPGERVVLRGTGLRTSEMVSTTGDWA